MVHLLIERQDRGANRWRWVRTQQARYVVQLKVARSPRYHSGGSAFADSAVSAIAIW